MKNIKIELTLTGIKEDGSEAKKILLAKKLPNFGTPQFSAEVIFNYFKDYFDGVDLQSNPDTSRPTTFSDENRKKFVEHFIQIVSDNA